MFQVNGILSEQEDGMDSGGRVSWEDEIDYGEDGVGLGGQGELWGDWAG